MGLAGLYKPFSSKLTISWTLHFMVKKKEVGDMNIIDSVEDGLQWEWGMMMTS